MNMIDELKDKILAGNDITIQEAVALLQVKDHIPLYDAAHEITQHFMGNQFDTCAIINAKSGNCPENCKWCAQSSHYHTGAKTYKLVPAEEAIKQATYDHKNGVHRFSLVASGRRPTIREIELMAQAYQGIKKANPEMKCCASLGLLTEEQLKILFDSGVTTYHCNMETAPSYFTKLCTTHTQADKAKTLAAARKVGMRICCGGIIGMGESMLQRIEFAFFLRKMKSKSIPINILQPIPGTPLGNARHLSEEEILFTIALFRLINPTSFLRFSGGRMQLSPDAQHKAVYIGINAAITGDLLTTVGQQTKEDMLMIKKCGKQNVSHDWEVAYPY